MITWFKWTKPCPIITWDGVVFNGQHHYVDHIYYMIHVRPFDLSVPRPYLYMLGSSSLTWVFHVCNYFSPIVFERRVYHTRSSRGVSARRTVAMMHTQGEHLYLEIIIRDHPTCYRRSKKIRCKNMINITCNQIVTWYGQYHYAPLISSSGHHDHLRHRHDTMISIIMISIIVSSWSRHANDYFYFYG